MKFSNDDHKVTSGFLNGMQLIIAQITGKQIDHSGCKQKR